MPTTALSTAKIQLAIAKDEPVDAATTHRGDPAGADRRVQRRDAGLERARRRANDLIDQIRLATLTAPIDGIVTAVNVVAGLEAPSGDAIVIDATTLPGHGRRRRERPRRRSRSASRRR